MEEIANRLIDVLRELLRESGLVGGTEALADAQEKAREILLELTGQDY